MRFSRSGIARPDITLIKKAVGIKSSIVAQDPFEKNVRKELNFGHTIGHAMESYSLSTAEPLLHGEAIAYGMAVETYIAAFSSLIDEEKAGFISHTLETEFDLKPLRADAVAGIMTYIHQDKKNDNGVIKMALIDDIGSCKTDVPVSIEEIKKAIGHFNKSVTPHTL